MPVSPTATSTLLCALLALTGCGSSTGGMAADQSAASADLALPDLTMPDLVPGPDLVEPPDLVPLLGIGMPCPNGNECMADLICLGPNLDPGLPKDGYCTRACKDDPDCGGGAFCGPPLDKGGNLCWLRCGPGDTCTYANQVCSRRLGGQVDLVNRACVPGNRGAREGSPCKTFGDCNKNQACLNNPYDFPGGTCITFGCTLGDSATCAPGGTPVCLELGAAINICLPGCTGDPDCRSGEGYRCQELPQSPMKVCVFPNPLGGHCKMPVDCNGGPPWVCLVDMKLPDGYCTIAGCDPKTNAGCPTNGHCVATQNTSICLKDCGGDPDCAQGTVCKPLGVQPGAPMACLPP